ncbi:PepSY domain-containing protein [Corynebacterium glyciniphilum]|uniref:PepSY-associated TM helix domain-containing protein n=1 Tax=Corynebacterium glyciniphilum TaxID=1404244 RepID=UPI00264E4E65|nr:PepSY domain-containing protein [Corynebacterium glyciniphilum]MDN5682744.1 PepSY domain-containing protein [Corynebacterium glyciniphilum]MDN6705043.1 PepSY domain-containing protein [Corynebacterium glyciniphilum]
MTSTVTTTGSTATPGPPTSPRAADRQQNHLLRRLHFFAGVVCAPLILVAAVTGLLYAFAPTVEQVTNHSMLTATAPDGTDGTEKLPVSELVATAQEEHPDLALSGVRIGGDGETTRVLFNDPGLPASTVQAVFLDPWTGEVKGDTTQYGSSASLPLRQWIAEGHRTAWLGEPGRLYSETAASWLGVLAVGGVVMWWQRQRKSQVAASKLRNMVRTGGRGRTRTMRLHGATGTLVVAGMVFLTVTGLTWSSVAGGTIGDLREKLSWGTPAVEATLPGAQPVAPSGGGAHAGHEGHAGHGDHAMPAGVRVSGLNSGSIDRVATTAEAELRAPVTITPPAVEGQAWTASEDRAAYRLSNDAVAIDWATGRVTDRLDFADWPLAAKATSWLIQLHMGTLFGLPNQLVLGLLAAAIIAMVCWGYMMWWKRRPAGGFAGPPRRAQWSRPTAGTLVLVAALVAYGVVAPLFGITCLAFVLVSALWDAARRRRGTPLSTPPR